MTVLHMRKKSKKKSRPFQRRQDSRSPSSDHRTNGYAVGYRRPPLHGRFQPGQSGNPAGRRKGLRNLKTDVQLALKTPVKLKESGRARNISTQEGMLMVLREKALKGDARALDRLLGLAGLYNNESGETVTQALSTDDQAILAAFADEIRSTRPSTGIEFRGEAESNDRSKAAEIVPISMPPKSGGSLPRIRLHRRPNADEGVRK